MMERSLVNDFNDPAKGQAVFDLQFKFSFENNQLSLKISNVGDVSLKITSFQINYGKILEKRDGSDVNKEFRINLIDRHVFDTDFKVTLGYSQNNQIFEKNFVFEVRITKLVMKHFI